MRIGGIPPRTTHAKIQPREYDEGGKKFKNMIGAVGGSRVDSYGDFWGKGSYLP